MKNRIWFIIIGLALLVGGGVYLYTFYKPHRDYKSEEAKHAVQAQEIHDLFMENETAANAQFLDHVIEVEGTITDINTEYVVLDDHIICSMAEGEGAKIIALGQGKKVVVKGRCVSWDSLFEEVRLDNCHIQ